MNNAQLVLKDFSGQIEITPTAFELKTRALALAKPIAKVETPEQQLQAVGALRELKAIRTGMESTRKAVKKPVLELGRKIDDIAHGFLAEVDKQYMRLTGMINHYQKKQAREAAEEEKKIEQRQATASELRQKASWLREAGDTAGAEKLEADAFDLEMTAELAVVPATEKPKGLVVRQKINFQVTDAIVFCQGYPQFWKWHADTETLKLDRMSILDELNREDHKGLFHRTHFPEELPQGDNEALVQPAGLRVFEEMKSHIR